MPRSSGRRRLLTGKYPEPLRAGLLLAQCATGFAAIALLIAAGMHSPLNAEANSPSGAAVAAAQGVRAIRAEPHRKKLFNERRARFAGSNCRSIADGRAEPANRQPLALH